MIFSSYLQSATESLSSEQIVYSHLLEPVYPSNHLSIQTSNQPHTYPPTNPSMYISIPPPPCSSINQSIYPFSYLPIQTSIYSHPSFHPSFHPSLLPSAHTHTHKPTQLPTFLSIYLIFHIPTHTSIHPSSWDWSSIQLIVKSFVKHNAYTVYVNYSKPIHVKHLNASGFMSIDDVSNVCVPVILIWLLRQHHINIVICHKTSSKCMISSIEE